MESKLKSVTIRNPEELAKTLDDFTTLWGGIGMEFTGRNYYAIAPGQKVELKPAREYGSQFSKDWASYRALKLIDVKKYATERRSAQIQ